MADFRVPEVPESEISSLSRNENLPKLLSRVLLARGIPGQYSISSFLDPPRDDLRISNKLPSLAPIARRILEVGDSGGSVLVYGDYDADGIIAATVLFGALKGLSISSNVYLPSRFGEGYGVSEKVLVRAKEQKYDLVVTVDCGVSAVDEVARAKEIGLEVLITDHHTPPDELPDTLIVNPLLEPSWNPEPEYNLSGAAVALGLAEELYRERGLDPERLLERNLELVALATIADIMKLIGINRAIVRHGLNQMWDTVNTGLRALLTACGLDAGVRPTAENLAFSVIPALNACGRMYSPNLTLKLFQAEHPDQAAALAHRIRGLNSTRRDVQAKVFEEAARSAQDFLDDSALVLFGEHWHLGVLGIVAAKISEVYGKPAVIISAAHSDGELLRGSARTSAGLDIRECLSKCSEHLVGFGGHPGAAGIVLEREKLDDFRRSLSNMVEYAEAASGEEEPYDADASAMVGELLEITETDLSRLAPFGEGSPAPQVALNGVNLTSAHAVGRDGTTLRATVGDGTGEISVVGFRMTHLLGIIGGGGRFNVILSIKPDVYRGERKVSYQLACAEEAVE